MSLLDARERSLVRHFLWRFLDHDLISRNADRHVALSTIGGGIAAVSLFSAVLIATPYVFSNSMPPGVVSLSALDDRFFFVSASMLIMALVALAAWDAVTLDARDAAAFGVLPVPAHVIARAKFMAIALMTLGAATAWNAIPALLRWVAVPAGLHLSVAGALRLSVAHLVCTTAAGVFGLLVVLGVRELNEAVLGPRWFARTSTLMQATLLTTFVALLLVLPSAHADVARNWLDDDATNARVFPPMWFVGLNEVLAGSAIDRLPRTEAGRLRFGSRQYAQSLEDQDAVASRLYRRLWPLYRELARTAVSALTVATVMTLSISTWNTRRRARTVPPPGRRTRRASRMVTNLLADLCTTQPLERAGFVFTLQTVARQTNHRGMLACSLAGGLALLMLTSGMYGAVSRTATGVSSWPLMAFATQTLFLAVLLGGFRHLVRIPADRNAGTTFAVAWQGESARYIAGVKRAGWVALVVPSLAGLLLWHSAVLGVGPALLHAIVGLAVSAVMLEVAFAHCQIVPLVTSYVPTEDVGFRGVAALGLLLCVARGLALAERFALVSLWRTALLVGALATVAGLIRRLNGAANAGSPPPDLELPVAMPTQRLSLSE